MPLYSSQSKEMPGPYGQQSFTDHTVEASGALSRVFNRLSNFARFDKKKAAKVGVTFALTYSFVSNINGSLSLSLAWYIASKQVSARRLKRIYVSSRVSANLLFLQTGLSPLVPGQWKALLAAYGGLYLFITIMRPLRVALAVSLTKKTESFLEQTQARLGCSRAPAIGLTIALSLLVWISCSLGGVALASELAGVPIWKL
jgi:hypothetical protein